MFLHLYDIRTQPQWLHDPKLVFLSIAVMEWWWGLGYHTMFFLAGLATIPKDLFDAARVDGASEWRMFWGITVFRLLPIILVLMVVRFGSAMAVIDEYIIVGGFDKTQADLYLDGLHVRHGVRRRHAVPGLCGRDRLGGRALDADRRRRHVLALPVARLARRTGG